jgi:hypothetical protein
VSFTSYTSMSFRKTWISDFKNKGSGAANVTGFG